MKIKPKDYLYSKIEKDQSTGCWNWTGCLFPKGYGFFKCKELNKQPMAASRASWIIHNGAIDNGKIFVCHKCDNRKCCNPDHLFLGSQKENMEDCKYKGRMNSGTDRPQSKLDWSKVCEMKWLYFYGWTYNKLAKHFGVSKSGVFSAINGLTWVRRADD